MARPSNNDNVVCFGALRNLQQWLEQAKKRKDWLWWRKSPHLTLSVWSPLKEKNRRWMRWNLDEIPTLWRSRSYFRQCSICLSALKVWDTIENRVCAAIVHGFRKPQITFCCIYTNTFTSMVSRGLDKPSPKLLGQDKPQAWAAAGRGLNKQWT